MDDTNFCGMKMLASAIVCNERAKLHSTPDQIWRATWSNCWRQSAAVPESGERIIGTLPKYFGHRWITIFVDTSNHQFFSSPYIFIDWSVCKIRIFYSFIFVSFPSHRRYQWDFFFNLLFFYFIVFYSMAKTLHWMCDVLFHSLFLKNEIWSKKWVIETAKLYVIIF